MMHVDLSALLAYLRGEGASDERLALEAHMRECAACSKELDVTQTFLRMLGKHDEWNVVQFPGARPPGIEAIVAIEERLAAEHAAAEVLLPRMHAFAQAAQARSVLPADWCTCGTIQCLLDEVGRVRDHDPASARALARLATQLAERIPLADAPPRLVMQLRGDAWRSYGDLLRHAGDFPAAHEALDEAEACYADTPTSDYHLALTSAIRAIVLAQQLGSPEALELLGDAAGVFLRYGDTERWATTRLREGAVAFDLGRFADARGLFESLIPRFRERGMPELLVRATLNLGTTLLALGDTVAARPRLHEARVQLAALHLDVELARARWVTARLLLATGHVADALTRLHSVEAQFRAWALPGDAGLVTLDIAEALLALGRSDEGLPLIERVVQELTALGASASARLALSYLQTAALARTATPSIVRHVRVYLERVSVQPNVPFTPPPA